MRLKIHTLYQNMRKNRLFEPPVRTLRAIIPENEGSSTYFGIYTLGRYISFASNN